MGFSGGASGKEPTCQCRRHKRRWLEPWVGEDPLEESKATHSSILTWRISWTEGPGGPQSTGSQRVGHEWRDLAQHTAMSLKANSSTVLLICPSRDPGSTSRNPPWQGSHAQAAFRELWVSQDKIATAESSAERRKLTLALIFGQEPRATLGRLHQG